MKKRNNSRTTLQDIFFSSLAFIIPVFCLNLHVIGTLHAHARCLWLMVLKL